MSYVDEVYENVVAKNPNEPEFHQAVKEVLDSRHKCCHGKTCNFYRDPGRDHNQKKDQRRAGTFFFHHLAIGKHHFFRLKYFIV